ncbi:MAG TPA: NAD(P)-dependent oxidoreductase [Gemmatimonadales bacterium]|nr:NAD(P)-dependent oxidoreductase [Gemmatimonadales bacterium]
MRAVVTGGAGFIGSHLIEALVARGDEVICVERPGGRTPWIEGLPIAYDDGGLADQVRLAKLLRGSDVVFHLAGLTEARRPADFYTVNADGTECVLRAAARHDGAAPRVILLSSLAALGPNRNGGLLGPDTAPRPLSHYGRSKLFAEAVLHAFRDRVPGTVIRLPSVYGPRERGVLKVFQLVRRGLALTVGGWDRELSLVYVRDVVSGLLAAASAPAAVGRTYCLAHPRPVTWRQFAQATGRAVGRTPRLVSLPPLAAWVVALAAEAVARAGGGAAILNRERLAELAQARWVCDPSRAEAELGFRAAYSVERGVQETAAWYRAAGWL